MLYCPKCKKRSLQSCSVEDMKMELDQCTECSGIWFDGGELESLLKDLAISSLEPASGSELTKCDCPRCSRPMYSFNYPQTFATIEMCKKCKGIWLDASEFEEIAAVREKLKKSGKLEKVATPGGVKGSLLNFISSAIDGLTKF